MTQFFKVVKTRIENHLNLNPTYIYSQECIYK
jgi:hypothetical protein